MEIDLIRINRRATLNIAAILFSRKIPTDEEWWMICPDLCAYPGKLSSSNSIYWQSDVSPILIYISSLMEPFLCRLALGLKWHNLQRMICCYYCLLLLYSSATPLSLHDKLLYFHCERIDSSVHWVRFNRSPFLRSPNQLVPSFTFNNKDQYFQFWSLQHFTSL